MSSSFAGICLLRHFPRTVRWKADKLPQAKREQWAILLESDFEQLFPKWFFQNEEVNLFERELRLIQNIFCDTKELSFILNSLTGLINNRLETSELYCIQSWRVYFMQKCCSYLTSDARDLPSVGWICVNTFITQRRNLLWGIFMLSMDKVSEMHSPEEVG